MLTLDHYITSCRSVSLKASELYRFSRSFSYRNTCSNYIWADDSVAVTRSLTIDLWYLNYPVETHWEQYFLLAFMLNRYLYWRMENIFILWKIFSNMHHFSEDSEESIPKSSWKGWVLFLQAGKRVGLTKCECQHKATKSLCSYRISIYFFFLL